jgi:hypothetical protein
MKICMMSSELNVLRGPLRSRRGVRTAFDGGANGVPARGTPDNRRKTANYPEICRPEVHCRVARSAGSAYRFGQSITVW